MASSLSETPADRSAALNERKMIALARLVLGSLALVIIYIDPTEPDQFVGATYTALIAYVLFGAVLYWAARSDRTLFTAGLNNPYWLDVMWYLVLISLSSGTGSVFFFFFYFAMLNAGFTGGFRSGIKVTLVAATAFSILGYIAAVSAGTFELDRFLLRPISLLVLGYLISYWGGHQVETIRRLRLLREIGLVSNPRFGVNRTLSVNLELLRRFFGAEKGLLVDRTPDGELTMRTCDEERPHGAMKPVAMPSGLGQSLMELPRDAAVHFNAGDGRATGPTCRAYGLKSRGFAAVDAGTFARVAEQLEASAFVTLPMKIHPSGESRLFLYSRTDLPIQSTDLEFLVQAIDHFSPIVENIGLIDAVATDAAVDERQRVARDLHDSIIQPYVGLKMGLESVLQVISADGARDKKEVLVERLEQLRTMTEDGISDLRAYIHGLKSSRGESSLAPSLERFIRKFSNATGIAVDLNIDEGLRLSDKLAAEVFQIVIEGLSNIRRHTMSTDARIGAQIRGRTLAIEISNDGEPKVESFRPNSITGRAVALGGNTQVNIFNGRTSVKVEIPL